MSAEPQNPELFELKKKIGLWKIFKLSVAMIVTSFLAIATGSVTYFFALPNLTLPIVFEGAIFLGIIIFISGVIGGVAARFSLRDRKLSQHNKNLVGCHFALLIPTICLSCVSIVYACWSFITCMSHDNIDTIHCLPDVIINVIMATLNLFIGLTNLILCLIGTGYFCVYRKTFGFKSKQEPRMQMDALFLESPHPQPNAPSLYIHEQPNAPSLYIHEQPSAPPLYPERQLDTRPLYPTRRPDAPCLDDAPPPYPGYAQGQKSQENKRIPPLGPPPSYDTCNKNT